MRVYVIAMECEADAIREHIAEGDRLIVSGIGKVAAAAAAQKAISLYGADEIVNAGLCGGFGNDVELFGAYEVEKAVEYDFDLAELNGTRVGVVDGRATPYFDVSTSGIFPRRILATGDRFTNDESDHGLIADELGASLRDMEGAAIAHVCEINGVPCRLYKVVSDIASYGAMTKQYLANKKTALEALSRAASRFAR